MPDYEDYTAKATPGSFVNPERVTTFEGKLRRVCKITDDPEGEINPRLCLYIEVLGEGPRPWVGVAFSDKKIVDTLIASLISARNTIWPVP